MASAAAKKTETPDPVVEVTEATVKELDPKHEGLFEAFVEMIEDDDDFAWLATFEDCPTCGVWVKKTPRSKAVDIPCYAVAEDVLGNYSVLTTKGEIRQFLAKEVE